MGNRKKSTNLNRDPEWATGPSNQLLLATAVLATAVLAT